jgi:Zn-dependent protease
MFPGKSSRFRLISSKATSSRRRKILFTGDELKHSFSKLLSYRQCSQLHGIPVFVHPLVLVWVLIFYLFGNPALGFINCALMFGLLIGHEWGHAACARFCGLSVWNISISPLHGACHFDEPRTSLEHQVIAWGGVLVQLLILAASVLFLCALRLLPASILRPWLLLLEPVSAIWIHWNIFLIILNLVPIPPLDGSIAWRIVPRILNGDVSRFVRMRRSIRRNLRS